ncbi:MAG: threonylcarbamoyl-AMP synthase [Caldilineales bacterium]|nr:threonylcarbamoyl-AMP synthase [Caldilineales bacterium]
MTFTAPDLAAVCAALAAGRLIVFPTDTVYGLAALAYNADAVRALYALKRRPHHLAIPVMIAETAQIERVARPLPGFAALAAHFWPGALTIILPRVPALPDIVTAGGETVAVRIPNHPFALDILRAIDEPLAVTSANLSGRPAALTAAEAHSQLGNFPLILDGGPALDDAVSTIIDLTQKPLRVLRPGPISAEALAAVLERPVLAE